MKQVLCPLQNVALEELGGFQNCTLYRPKPCYRENSLKTKFLLFQFIRSSVLQFTAKRKSLICLSQWKYFFVAIKMIIHHNRLYYEAYTILLSFLKLRLQSKFCEIKSIILEVSIGHFNLGIIDRCNTI